MKMKEVCMATGLTERAVRFYVQEQLVFPQSQRRGGRTWLDFSQVDVDRLKAISVLRKAGFTIGEIRSMVLDFQKNAPDASFALRRRLQHPRDAQEMRAARPASFTAQRNAQHCGQTGARTKRQGDGEREG